jgi:hypothetical protein
MAGAFASALACGTCQAAGSGEDGWGDEPGRDRGEPDEAG